MVTFADFLPLFYACGSIVPFADQSAHVAIFKVKRAENGSKKEKAFFMNVNQKKLYLSFLGLDYSIMLSKYCIVAAL
jgi:hypothetical protein